MITLSDVKIIEEDVKKVKTANATLSCPLVNRFPVTLKVVATYPCLLYTSDAADE